MSELRSPDPTLWPLVIDIFVDDRHNQVPVAHRWDIERLKCGELPTGMLGMRPRHAAFIAAPCRECFPDAPPPGNRVWQFGGEISKVAPDHGLSWQVTQQAAPC